MSKVTLVETLSVSNTLGEGIIWYPEEQSVYWTDIQCCTLFAYNLSTQNLSRWSTPERLCSFAPVAGQDRLLAGFESGFAYFRPADGDLHWLHKIHRDDGRVRLNDGRADRQGRFWAGSMIETEGSAVGGLYCLHQDHKLTTQLTGLSISNGLCWSPDSRFVYHTDTPSQTIHRYEFDAGTGTLGTRTNFATTESGCFPDGSCVDAEGYVWNAQWGGSKIVRYSPDGEVDTVVPVPASQPTCLTFAGENLDLMVVTSATQDLSPDELSQQDQAGNLFIYQTGVKGLPDPCYIPTQNN